MEHQFFTTPATRVEAYRFLTAAENLLSRHDLVGSKSFATRARDTDPTLSQADEILAIVDTLLAGKRRMGNNQRDWYGILRLTPPQVYDAQLIANQYHKLVLILNPQRNKLPFAEQAIHLVYDAWSVLSNPLRKSLYDKELSFYMQPPQPNPFSGPIPPMQQNFNLYGGAGAQPLLHGGGSSSLGVNQCAQVHAQPRVGGSTREPQNFVGFTTGYNSVFESGFQSGYEPVNNQGRESYSTFARNVASGSVVNQEQLYNLDNQSQQNYSNVNDETIHNVNESKNVGEAIEDKEDVQGIDVEEREAEEERVDSPLLGDGSSFWTACPYCFYMYEYPQVYADCALLCQNCKKAFQAVVIPSPPPKVDGQEAYYCCWGSLPFGFSMEDWKKCTVAASGWAPFSPMFSFPQMGNNVNEGVGLRNSASRVNVDNDVVIVEISDDEEQADMNRYEKNKAEDVKGKAAIWMPGRSEKKLCFDQVNNGNFQDAVVSPEGMELPNNTSEQSEEGAAANAVNQPGRVMKDFGQLDLNVEFSNDIEEPAMRMDQGSGSGRGEDDNMEGNGFFEGLDEYLLSLPILNVVRDDKVVKAT